MESRPTKVRKVRSLAGELLHVVLAEVPKAGLVGFTDYLHAEDLRDGNHRYFATGAARTGARALDALLDGGQLILHHEAQFYNGSTCSPAQNRRMKRFSVSSPRPSSQRWSNQGKLPSR